MNGLIGLTQNINTREGATQELAVLERMDQRRQQDEQAEMQAQAMQNEMYERLYAQADELLVKDRKKINEQLRISQRQVMEHLNQSGASLKDFYANGGISFMGELGNSIVQSDAAETYKANKQNLAKIMEAQEKGLGHLLSPNDLKSLEDYQNNEEGGRITYSGMMAEIEIPHDKFALGSEIHPFSIMSHNANLTKILGNYATVYPDRPTPEPYSKDPKVAKRSQAEIVAFMRKMGYGGMGSSATLLQQRAAQAKARAEHEAKQTEGSPKTALSTLNQITMQMPDGLTVDQILSSEEDYMEEFLNSEGGAAARAMFSDPFKSTAIRRTASHVRGLFNPIEGVTELWDKAFGDEMSLKGGRKLAITQTDQQLIAQEALGVVAEGGVIKDFQPESTFYRADGVQLGKGKAGWDERDYKGNWKVLGITTAFKTAVDNGDSGESEPILLVDVYNGGKVDKKATAKMYDTGIKGSPAELTYTIALQGEEGDIIYKEIELDKPAIRKALSAAFPNDNITEVVNQDKAANEHGMKIDAMQAEEQVAVESAIPKVKEVFEDPMFHEEGEKYWGAGSGGQMNRNKEMQSFYMAMDFIGNMYNNGKADVNTKTVQSLVDKNAFTTSMKIGEVEDLLKDYKVKPQQIAAQWLENVNQGETSPLVIRRNEEIAMKWQQILKLL